MKAQRQDGLLQAEDGGPGTNPPCRPLAFRLPAPKLREDTLLLCGRPFHELQMGLKLLLVVMMEGKPCDQSSDRPGPNQPYPMATATPSPRRDTLDQGHKRHPRPGVRYLLGRLGPQTTRGLRASALITQPTQPPGLRFSVVTQPPRKPSGRKASEILTELPDNHPQQEERNFPPAPPSIRTDFANR